MKEIIVEKPGGYISLIIKARDDPKPGRGEYLVRTKFIGVNYADIIVREGYYTAARGKYPLVPGFEYAGVIEEAGEEANSFKIGDQVCGITLFGGYASAQIATEQSIVKIPSNWSMQEAAGLLVANLTAYHALHNVAHTVNGETILVHSAAGGVGTALLQHAKNMACNTIAIVGHHSKRAVAEQYGASQTVLKSKAMWEEVDKLAPDGFDVIFDANGLTTPRPGYDRLKLGGRLVIYGFAELFPRGRRPWLPVLIVNSLRVPKFRIRKLTSTNRGILGFNIAFLVERTDLAKPAIDFIINAAACGLIEKPIIKIFPFNQVINAHKHLESGASVGKTLLQVE